MTFENHQYYNCKVVLENNETFLLDANWIHNNQLDCWKDWSCSAGSLRLCIDEKFDVYSGECNNDYLGNLNTGWAPLSEPTVCKKDRCSGCTDDLLVQKQQGLKK